MLIGCCHCDEKKERSSSSSQSSDGPPSEDSGSVDSGSGSGSSESVSYSTETVTCADGTCIGGVVSRRYIVNYQFGNANGCGANYIGEFPMYYRGSLGPLPDGSMMCNWQSYYLEYDENDEFVGQVGVTAGCFEDDRADPEDPDPPPVFTECVDTGQPMFDMYIKQNFPLGTGEIFVNVWGCLKWYEFWNGPLEDIYGNPYTGILGSVAIRYELTDGTKPWNCLSELTLDLDMNFAQYLTPDHPWRAAFAKGLAGIDGVAADVPLTLTIRPG